MSRPRYRLPSRTHTLERGDVAAEHVGQELKEEDGNRRRNIRTMFHRNPSTAAGKEEVKEEVKEEEGERKLAADEVTLKKKKSFTRSLRKNISKWIPGMSRSGKPRDTTVSEGESGGDAIGNEDEPCEAKSDLSLDNPFPRTLYGWERKIGLRVSFEDIWDMYQPYLDPTVFLHFGEDKKAFTVGILTVLDVNIKLLKIGDTHVLFTGNANILHDLLQIDMIDNGNLASAKLNSWIVRKRWRRAYIYTLCGCRFLRLLKDAADARRAVSMIENKWLQLKRNGGLGLAKKMRLFAIVISAQKAFLTIEKAAESSLTTIFKISVMRWSRLTQWKAFSSLRDQAFALDELCVECNVKQSMRWCRTCKASYCNACCKSVHTSCHHMRVKHTIITHIYERQETDLEIKASSPPPHPQPIDHRLTSIIHSKMMGKSADCSIKGCTTPASRGMGIRFCEEHFRECRDHVAEEGAPDEVTTKLQQTVMMLRKQLKAAGQDATLEYMELPQIREKMAEAVQRLMAGDEKAENEIEKFDKMMRMHPDYHKEQEEKFRQWCEDNKAKNEECLQIMRSYVPPDIARSNIAQMLLEGLPQSIANRIWNKKALWFVRTHTDDIKRMHIADLRNRGNQGLDIVEIRAIWQCLPSEFDNDGDGQKAEWLVNFRQKVEEMINKENRNALSKMEKRHAAYKGYEDLRVHHPDAPLERLAALKSNAFGPTEKVDIMALKQEEQPSAPVRAPPVAAVTPAPALAPVPIPVRTSAPTSAGGDRGALLAGITSRQNPSPHPHPNPMGGLMAAIAARKKDGENADADPNPRGGLMAAIAAKNRDGESSDAKPNPNPRGGLMAAIAARNRDGENAEANFNPTPNPRGGLMAAIAARNRETETPSANPNPSSRGGLLAAIAARSRDGENSNPNSNPNPNPNPRGGLLAAIAARKNAADPIDG